MITISLIGLGLFLAGLYPTSVALAGLYMKGSTNAMSLLTAISCLGGVITPQVVGMVADNIGIVPAISVLSVNALMMVMLAVVIFVFHVKKT